MKLDLRSFDNCGNCLSKEFDDNILKSRTSFVAKWRELLANIAKSESESSSIDSVDDMDTDTSIVTDVIDIDCAVRTVYSSDQKLFVAISFRVVVAQTLKPKHSLIGKCLIPVIAKVKATGSSEVGTLARLKRQYPLEDYSLAELRTEFEKPTGESVKDVIHLTGKEDNLEGVRLLVHLSILHANMAGAPKGQTLTVVSPEAPTVEKPTTEASGSVDSQLKTMRQDLDALKNLKDGVQADEALATVRTLASRPKLTSPNVLMAAIEHLVEIANKTNLLMLFYFPSL